MSGLDFLNAGRSYSNVGGMQTSPGGVSDPRDPTAGGGSTLAQSSSRVGFVNEFTSGFGDVFQGRLSLLMLDTLILLMVAFYLWTHKVQGGG
jgi:hypothetical protein